MPEDRTAATAPVLHFLFCGLLAAGLWKARGTIRPELHAIPFATQPA